MRGKKKHDIIEEKLYDINETELPAEGCIEHITAFWWDVYQSRGVARGGGGGVHKSPGAKVEGRQNEAYKTFTRVKTIVDYANYV